LSEAERAAAFTTGTSPVDRAAALRAGSTPIPRRFFLWVAVAFAALGLGGVVGEKLIGSAGISALTSVPTTTLAGTGRSFPVAPATPDTPTPPAARPVDATPSAVTGLIQLTARPAPAVSTLQDQAGANWNLADARGKVVVLTFFNAECDDICPVLADEITQADQLLGARRRSVDFVVVNSDPLETSLAPSPPALTQTHLDGISNVTFLNGPLTALSSVWKHYGITVELNPTTRVSSHTEAMYFVDRQGQLRLEATPFANENSLGVYSLDPTTIHSFAEGMADSAGRLAGRTS
jgi:protein SCO1/2